MRIASQKIQKEVYHEHERISKNRFSCNRCGSHR